MFSITESMIDTDRLLAQTASVDAGATVLFIGSTRRMTGERETVFLSYESYQEMALKKMEQLGQEAADRWSIQGCAMTHRIGEVPLGEASVAVAVSAAHREEAFAAARWLIDTLKEVVPIWKQEHWADGTDQWVHPGVGEAADE